MSGCNLNIKIGECPRPSTYKLPTKVPDPTNYEEAWVIKSKAPNPVWANAETAYDEATQIAAAWLKHPANKMQLTSLQKEHDLDNDGRHDRSEFKTLLKAAGSSADANLVFDQMDKDGDGFLSEDEIKALGQDSDGRAQRRGLA